MQASMIRASHKTYEGFHQMHNQLEQIAAEYQLLPLAGQTLAPLGWDSPAFCSNSMNAYNFQYYLTVCNSSKKIKPCVRDWRASKKIGSLQKREYNVLHSDDKCNWVQIIKSKAYNLGGNLQLENSFSDSSYTEFIESFNVCPSSVRASYFKTLINSWATTYRYQERVKLPCIFGCDEMKDDLKHYLCCEPLWTLAVTSASLPGEFLTGTHIDRLCLLSNSVAGIRLLGVVSRGYHTLKFEYRKRIDSCVGCGDFTDIHLLFVRIVQEAWRRP